MLKILLEWDPFRILADPYSFGICYIIISVSFFGTVTCFIWLSKNLALMHYNERKELSVHTEHKINVELHYLPLFCGTKNNPGLEHYNPNKIRIAARNMYKHVVPSS